MTRRAGPIALWCAAVALPLACAPAAPIATLPPTPRSASADTTTMPGTAARGAVAEDVEFMRGMIAHHAQALQMTELVPSRAGRDDIRLLAQRIEVSQQDEIAQMSRWLRTRGEGPSATGHRTGHQHAGGEALMPGMLTSEELQQLAASSGVEFDRRFLELMIRHHEGALTMVSTLLASGRGGLDTEVFRFASDVDADQRAEIARMRRLLEQLPAGSRPR